MFIFFPTSTWLHRETVSNHFLGSKAVGHGTVDLFVEGGGGPKHHKKPSESIWMEDFDWWLDGFFFSSRAFLTARRSKGTGLFYWAASRHRLFLYWPVSRCACGREGISVNIDCIEGIAAFIPSSLPSFILIAHHHSNKYGSGNPS